MELESVLEKFQRPQKNGKGFIVQCPTHDDKKNSLSVFETPDRKILFKCQAGCETKTILDAVGLEFRDLSNSNGQPAGDTGARYVYTNENSKPLFRVVRTREKGFFQQRFDAGSGKFIAGLNGMARVLYRLPDVLKAETVYVAEGEKDADRLSSLGLTATTNSGGAGKWLESYSPTLTGKTVVIFPDNDEPGANHALQVAKSVKPYAASVKIVSLPNLPPKGDVSDFLSQRSKDDLLALVESAKPFTGVTDSKGQANLWPEFLTAEQALEVPKDPARWIVADCLPIGGSSVLVAKPKVGKSTIAADLALCVARGEPFLGRATQQSPVAYVFLDGPLTDIADTFVKVGLRKTDPVFIHAGIAPADTIAWLLATVNSKSVRLIIIDTIQRLCHFQKIEDYAEITNKLEPLLNLAITGNCHVMFLHHAKKESRDDLDAALGSTAFRALVYSYLFAKRLPDSTRRIFSSDQRGGVNFDQMGVGFDRTTGRLRIEGTMMEVEVEDAGPKILEFLEFLETEDEGATEKKIGEALSLRGIVISKGLRKLFRDGKVERVGKGRRNSPFLYSLASTLLDENASTFSNVTSFSSYSSSSRDSEEKINGIIEPGTESKNPTQDNKNAQEILFPKNPEENPEENGKETEEKRKENESGRESGRVSKDGWEEMP